MIFFGWLILWHGWRPYFYRVRTTDAPKDKDADIIERWLKDTEERTQSG